MNRKKLVNALIKEGFSEKTLINMPDNQIKLLSLRFLNEQEDDTTMYVPKDDKNKIERLKNDDKQFVAYEEEVDEGKVNWAKNSKRDNKLSSLTRKNKDKKKPIENVDNKKLARKQQKGKKTDNTDKKNSQFVDEKKQVEEWVEQLVQPKKNIFTTKNEIMEVINLKLNEQFAEPEIAEPEVAPDVAEPETPSKEPGKKPYHDPWKEPGKGPDPKPKMEKGSDELPDWLTFDSIVSSVNESKIENLAKNILSEIKKLN